MLKAMGNQPFAMGRHASSIDIIAAPEQVAACRWGYQCSVCLLAGDLLCCEVGVFQYPYFVLWRQIMLLKCRQECKSNFPVGWLPPLL